MEVNDLPPPLAIAATGPLRVELKLASGECHSKGCRPGGQHRSRRAVLVIKMFSDAKLLNLRGERLQFLLHTARVSNHQTAEGRNLCSGELGGPI